MPFDIGCRSYSVATKAWISKLTINFMKTISATKILVYKLALVLSLACVSAPFAPAQQTAKKSYVFKGKVETVGARTLTVANERIEGWMEAMTMAYPVDKPEVLKNIKAGDQITATVYDGDSTLHDVHVVPAAAKK
jgi:Cu/Ag efflux protein CusF